MRRRRRSHRAAAVVLGIACCLSGAAVRAAEPDPILRAMRDEIQRSRALKILNLDTPYYIAYRLDDLDNFSVSASMGGLIAQQRQRIRIPDVQVRVGDYKFDNTNYIASGFPFGSRYDIGRFPLDDSYAVLRRFLWLATDSAYKSAVETISRKRAALKNVTVTEQLADFAPAEPVRQVHEQRRGGIDEKRWSELARSLSALLGGYAPLRESGVELQAGDSTYYMVSSEGAEVRIPERLIFVRARASAQAADGMTVRDAVVFHGTDLRLPADEELRRGVGELGQNVAALAAAPVGEAYTGPVLFEGRGAAQLFAEVLGRNLAPVRRPVLEPGRNAMIPASELEGRMGARVLPDWIDVVDDPGPREVRGRPLLGSYDIDREAVVPKPLHIVEKGVLSALLLTRQPVRGHQGSNGRARLPGSFGAQQASMSNLFVRASESMPLAQLKKRLLDIVRARQKPYGLLVRKMDFPSSASLAEARRLLAGVGQSGASSIPVSLPILIYRVYPDGREELVRGLRFRGLDTRSLRDIVAAANDTNVFEFLDSAAPFALMGAARYVTEACAVAPSVLIDDLELRRVEEDQPRLPIVPPPPVRP